MSYEKFIEKLIKKYGEDRSSLIEMAFDIQEAYGYIPKELLRILCEKMKIPYAEAYSSISFFKDFRFSEPEKIVIGVCYGTSCYFNGGKQLYEEINKIDQEDIEVHTVYCYKCCAQYPVATINDEVILNASVEKICSVILQQRKPQC
ncbi:MAG: NAD(P)H-dependent oxidoreductase subunit E [Candidatus Calescibacterium sp.]|nr:NAD(P)H-dependent oxidoreductase subunit E [Candidatus Calescibacterium sp.]MCX7972290.1 NAD(P)H-dependent oxidoreductase subunit E [bacterium]MDW8195106.1 NAD(P)H-dependent oxidoreductase subunit E [Candidatus Calescibacterium sp.]